MAQMCCVECAAIKHPASITAFIRARAARWVNFFHFYFIFFVAEFAFITTKQLTSNKRRNWSPWKEAFVVHPSSFASLSTSNVIYIRFWIAHFCLIRFHSSSTPFCCFHLFVETLTSKIQNADTWSEAMRSTKRLASSNQQDTESKKTFSISGMKKCKKSERRKMRKWARICGNKG